ncbi:MAG TPA: hypothetical protein VK627_09835 [Edaphobacter sp.]|jgi:hypothetical protein|nr:hypothetical protein [Edaphobacter sp.]
MNEVKFFALRDDLLLVLGEVEGKMRPRYTRADYYGSPVFDQWERASEIPQLGIAIAGQVVAWTSYLIMETATQVVTKPFQRRDGTVVYLVDQLLNPDSVFLTAGGVLNDEIIVAGRVVSFSDSAASGELMRQYRTAIERHFTKGDIFWIGPAALADGRNGRRLKTTAKTAFDVELPELQAR